MKIGVLTFHRAHNYGAVLQCYALKTIFDKLGNNTQVIDYRQPIIEAYYQTSWRTILGFIRRLNFTACRLHLNRLRRRKHFDSFIAKYLNVSMPCQTSSIPQTFDAYVVGSDQLWGKHCMDGKFDDVYLGNFKRPAGSKLFSYAIGTNKDSLQSLTAEQLKLYIGNFDSFSFRELTYYNLVLEKSGIMTHVDLDPTLLLDSTDWITLINDSFKNRKPYIVLYQVRRDKTNPMLLNEKAGTLAKQLGYDIIDLSDIMHPVEDFLSAIKYARCVITSSFHASVFATIFHIPLYAITLNDGHDDRYVDLLKAVGAETCITDISDIIVGYPKPLDYTKVDKALQKLKQPSIDYLKTSLQ